MTRTIPVSEARQTLPVLVSRLYTHLDRVIITRKGKTEAVLMGVEVTCPLGLYHVDG